MIKKDRERLSNIVEVLGNLHWPRLLEASPSLVASMIEDNRFVISRVIDTLVICACDGDPDTEEDDPDDAIKELMSLSKSFIDRWNK